MADDQPLLGEPLEDLGQQLLWNRELLRDTLGADGTLVVNGDVVNRHEAVIGALGEAKHLPIPSDLMAGYARLF